MDVGLVINNPIGQAVGSVSALPRPTDSGFATTMANQLDDRTSTVERAEQMVGGRIRAPEGGCGCDAFIATVAPESPTSSATEQPARQTAAPFMPAFTPTFDGAQSQDFSPGQILEFDDATDLSGHVHRAILRNATEMITANQSGLVEVLSIPWGQVQRR